MRKFLYTMGEPLEALLFGNTAALKRSIYLNYAANFNAYIWEYGSVRRHVVVYSQSGSGSTSTIVTSSSFLIALAACRGGWDGIEFPSVQQVQDESKFNEKKIRSIENIVKLKEIVPEDALENISAVLKLTPPPRNTYYDHPHCQGKVVWFQEYVNLWKKVKLERLIREISPTQAIGDYLLVGSEDTFLNTEPLRGVLEEKGKQLVECQGIGYKFLGYDTKLIEKMCTYGYAMKSSEISLIFQKC